MDMPVLRLWIWDSVEERAEHLDLGPKIFSNSNCCVRGSDRIAARQKTVTDRNIRMITIHNRAITFVASALLVLIFSASDILLPMVTMKKLFLFKTIN